MVSAPWCSRVKSWKDLADAFIKQNWCNLEIAPTRNDFQNKEKKSTKTFKEYVQRWREQVAQVKIPLIDSELATIFIDTLKFPFYKFLIKMFTNNFVELLTTTE